MYNVRARMKKTWRSHRKFVQLVQIFSAQARSHLIVLLPADFIALVLPGLAYLHTIKRSDGPSQVHEVYGLIVTLPRNGIQARMLAPLHKA